MILWERITELSTDGIVKIVDFGKKVPGFQDLQKTNRLVLLKAACLEILVGVNTIKVGARVIKTYLHNQHTCNNIYFTQLAHV